MQESGRGQGADRVPGDTKPMFSGRDSRQIKGESDKEAVLRLYFLLLVQQEQGLKKSAQARLAKFCLCSCQQVEDSAQRTEHRLSAPDAPLAIGSLFKENIFLLPFGECACHCFTIYSFHVSTQKLWTSLHLSVLNAGSGLHQPDPEPEL